MEDSGRGENIDNTNTERTHEDRDEGGVREKKGRPPTTTTKST